MKRTALLLPLFAAAIISCNNGSTENSKTTTDTTVAMTEPAKETPPAPPMDSATMMKKMQEHGTPGDMHKMLAASAGKWSAEVTSWMDPAKPPMKSALSIERKMVMNGLYLQETAKGDMMGMPFEGVATTGFDNSKKVFISTWMDNMSSGMMHMEGTWDDGSKTLTLKGKMTDCTTGKDADMKQVVTYTDDKHEHMEMFYTGADGKEMKSMEINYTRK